MIGEKGAFTRSLTACLTGHLETIQDGWVVEVLAGLGITPTRGIGGFPLRSWAEWLRA